jgi:hypothetical protein
MKTFSIYMFPLIVIIPGRSVVDVKEDDPLGKIMILFIMFPVSKSVPVFEIIGTKVVVSRDCSFSNTEVAIV